MEKKNVIFNHTLEQYNKKYKNRNHRLLKYTKKEVEDFDKRNNTKTKNFLLEGRRWWFINNTYYEIPKPIRYTWFRNLNAGIQITTCALIGVGIATAVIVPTIMTFNQNKPDSRNVEITGSGKDLIKSINFTKQSDGSYKGKLEFIDGKSKEDIQEIIIKAGNKVLAKDEDYTIVDCSDITIKPGVITDNDNITVEVVKKEKEETSKEKFFKTYKEYSDKFQNSTTVYDNDYKLTVNINGTDFPSTVYYYPKTNIHARECFIYELKDCSEYVYSCPILGGGKFTYYDEENLGIKNIINELESKYGELIYTFNDDKVGFKTKNGEYEFESNSEGYLTKTNLTLVKLKEKIEIELTLCNVDYSNATLRKEHGKDKFIRQLYGAFDYGYSVALEYEPNKVKFKVDGNEKITKDIDVYFEYDEGITGYEMMRYKYTSTDDTMQGVDIHSNSFIHMILPAEDKDEYYSYDSSTESLIYNRNKPSIDGLDYLKVNKYGLIDKSVEIIGGNKITYEITYDGNPTNFKIRRCVIDTTHDGILDQSFYLTSFNKPSDTSFTFKIKETVTENPLKIQLLDRKQNVLGETIFEIGSQEGDTKEIKGLDFTNTNILFVKGFYC